MGRNLDLIKLVLLTALLVLTSCDQVRKAKMYTRHYILGIPLQAETTQNQTETKDYSKEAKVITEITPQKKVYNLINGFISFPETKLKDLISNELKKGITLFNKDDQELISLLNRLSAFALEGNSDAIEMIIQAYVYLDGANKETAGLILAGVLESEHSVKLIELYFQLKKENLCSFAGLLNQNLDDEKKVQLWQSRKIQLYEFSKLEKPDTLKGFALECDKEVQLEFERFKMKREKLLLEAKTETPIPEVISTEANETLEQTQVPVVP